MHLSYPMRAAGAVDVSGRRLDEVLVGRRRELEDADRAGRLRRC